MSPQATRSEPRPVLGPVDPPADFSREAAAYERDKEGLVRDYLGWMVLVHQDEVVGVFRTPGEAILAGFHRFGDAKIMVREITATDEADFVTHVDINHPSIHRLG